VYRPARGDEITIARSLKRNAFHLKLIFEKATKGPGSVNIGKKHEV
jgi:hypothetical protein